MEHGAWSMEHGAWSMSLKKAIHTYLRTKICIEDTDHLGHMTRALNAAPYVTYRVPVL